MLQLERLQAGKVQIPGCGSQVTPAGSWLLLEVLGALCAVGVTHSNHRAGAEREISALGQLARKDLWKLFILFGEKTDLVNLNFFSCQFKFKTGAYQQGGNQNKKNDFFI